MSFNGSITKKLKIRIIKKNTSYEHKTLSKININNWFWLRRISNIKVKIIKNRIKYFIITKINYISLRMHIFQACLLT